MSYEHAREVSVQSEPVSNNAEFLVDANKIQIILALLSYATAHPDVSLDMKHPENLPKELRNEALSAWIEGYASDFRTYAEEHPHDLIDLTDPQALKELLLKIHPTDTLH